MRADLAALLEELAKVPMGAPNPHLAKAEDEVGANEGDGLTGGTAVGANAEGGLAGGDAAGALEVLYTHLTLLARWNPRYGLTRITDWSEILDRHVRESLVPLPWIGSNGRFLDVGSGNGFPALPILACRPALEAVLTERSENKSLFLDTVVRETGLTRVKVETLDLQAARPRTVWPPHRAHRRARTNMGRDGDRDEHDGKGIQPHSYLEGEGGCFAYVISRATLSAERYLDLAGTWIQPGGRVFLYAGRAAEEFCLGASTTHGLRLQSRVPLGKRQDSYLYVLEAPHVMAAPLTQA